MSNVVGERYQITIDRKVREELGVEPGDSAIERVEDGRMVVSFVPRGHRESLLGILRRPEAPPIEDWGGLMEDTRRARSADILAALEPRGSRRRRGDD
jgi:bifunctional DNA-binding transcriptional regulator/antitoxin component of YhaV-PrlF toxin-antitoxin module